jgi:phosphoribosylamine---glycine ligase
LLPEAKDYKRVGEKDTGLNTGGMGAISPVPFADDAFMDKVIKQVVEPTVQGLQKDNLDYKGFIFFGLIKVDDEPYVIEYNCRMGDPETEVVIPRIKNDLVELLTATYKEQLHTVSINKDPRFATTIVAVSGGYPNEHETGFEIIGLNDKIEDSILFHSATKEQDGKIVTAGGRIVCATALADTLQAAIQLSKERLELIEFTDMYYRRDVGYEFGI